MRRDVRHGWQTLRLLYRVDRTAFIIGACTSVVQSMVYPLMLVIVWQALSMLVTGSGAQEDVARRAAVLLVGLFILLALQTILRVVNETATSLLQAESSQHINGRIMQRMPEVPYHLFEDNEFQARYGLLINQASYRPGMLIESLVGCLSSLAGALAIAVTLLALAPVVDVFLLILIPVSIAEARYHARIIELQAHSAPALFRMTYLTQKSVDATWQRDIRVHRSTILIDEFRALARSYLADLKQLLGRYQLIRLAVGLGAAAVMTLAVAGVFWIVSHSPTGLADAAVLLPALVMGLSQGRSLSASWGVLTECLGYLGRLFDFLDEPFDAPEVQAREDMRRPVPVTVVG